MATHSFPAPPDLSELLKFFALSSYDQPRSSAAQQLSSRRRRDGPGAGADPRSSSAPSQRQRHPRGGQDRVASAPILQENDMSTHVSTSRGRRESPPKDTSNDWNGSTQIPIKTAKPLKHQILDRTYQPPAPVVVNASGATHLVQRLSKTTVSSRLKRHQADEAAAALAAATAALANAFERRGLHQKSRGKYPRDLYQAGADTDGDMGRNALSAPSPSDSRARDGIQTLLMYRREVEKRLSMDPTHFPTTNAAGEH